MRGVVAARLRACASGWRSLTARRAPVVLATAMVSLACVLLLPGASAFGATGHKLEAQLTEAPTGTPLGAPEGLAVDQKGDVFVADATRGLIDEYGSSGQLKTQFGAGAFQAGVSLPGIAVDEASGDVYVIEEPSVLHVFKPNGTGGYEPLSTWEGAHLPAGFEGFGELGGVAVSSGEVYLADRGNGTVDVFKTSAGQEGEFVTFVTGKPEFEEPDAVAVNSTTHQVYVGDSRLFEEAGGVEVFKEEAPGTFKFEHSISGKKTPAKEIAELDSVSFDPATGDVYVAERLGRAVDQFNAAGTWTGSLTGTEPGQLFGEPASVAVAPGSTFELYVADTQRAVVDKFGPTVTVPSVKTLPAPPESAFKRGTAPTFEVELRGRINPEGKEAEYRFEYEEERAFDETGTFKGQTHLNSAGSGSTEVKVGAIAVGLKPETAYVFRITGKNENGESHGVIVRGLEPPSAVAALSTGAPTNVLSESATLTGSLDPEGLETQYHFEYGLTTFYGKKTATVTTKEPTPVAAEAPITELTPNTTYHVRLVASNAWGTTFGEDVTFTTSGPPRVSGESSEPNGHTGETIKAKVNPDKLDTHYHFEYGETTAYGTNVPSPGPEEDIGSGATAVPVSAKLENLKLATTYHFRVVAENSAGRTVGPDQQFTTVLIESESATEVTGEGATLQAQINPLGAPATYHFEYGETTAGETSFPDQPVPSGGGDQTVSQVLANLRANTTYHYHVVVDVSGFGTASGPDRTFTTHNAATTPQLPDGRQYEMVSPPEKHGGYIEGIGIGGGLVQASEGGDAFGYTVQGTITEDAEGNRSPEVQQVLATRSPGGWSSQEIVGPHEHAAGLEGLGPAEYLKFSPELSLSLVEPPNFGHTPLAEPPLSPPQTEAERGHQEKTIYLRNNVRANGEPVPPAPAEAAIYAEAKHQGEVLAAERGEGAAKPGYLPLVSLLNVKEGTPFGGTIVTSGEEGGIKGVRQAMVALEASPDLSHVVIESGVPLAPKGSPPACRVEGFFPSCLYEWGEVDGKRGQLQLVSVLPSGEPETEHPVELGHGPKTIEHQAGGFNLRHAISTDGSRVVWTTEETIQNGVQGFGHLYLTNTAKQPAESIQLDLPTEGAIEGEAGQALYQLANSDDSKIFFTDTQRLTPDSTAAPEGHGIGAAPPQPDLYECEVVETGGKLACNLRDLTVDHNGGESAAVQGSVLGVSEDGSYVYLVADGVLGNGTEEGAAPGNCRSFRSAATVPPAGTTCNLYVLHESGGSWTTKFIARLSSEDAPDWLNPNHLRAALVNQTSRVSPNGNFLAFMSDRSLTGYDNTDVNEETGRHADEEVFLYDATSSTPLRCASCDPSGARPRGILDTPLGGEGKGLAVDRPGIWAFEPLPSGVDVNGGVAHWLAANVPGWTPTSTFESRNQARYLTDDGRVFFNSADPLVPQVSVPTRPETISGKTAQVGVENVYEYERNGTGSCARETGCVSLISDGSSPHESAFLDASTTGSDVFLLTAAPLVPQSDHDPELDVYDARECGASQCVPPPPPPSQQCEETVSCRPGSSSPQTFVAPPSSALSGAGNLVPPKNGVKPITVKKLTRAQMLAKALKACGKLPHKTRAQKHKQAKCRAQAKKKYGPKQKAKPKKKSKKQGKK
jgi:hypothetical protein